MQPLTKILKRARAQGGDMVVHWAAARPLTARRRRLT
jgi:hypothetical protein